MKRALLFFAVFASIICSCKNNDTPKSEPTAIEADSVNYYAQYTGTIGNIPVTLNLVKFEGGYSINYIAADKGNIVELRYQKDSLLKNDSLFFTASGDLRRGIYGPESETHFHLFLTAAAITGSQISGDKKTSRQVLLKRNNHYIDFVPLVYIDSVRSDGFKKDTPTAHVSLVILHPPGASSGGNWFSSVIKKEVLEELATDSVTTLQNSIVRYGKNFLQDFDDDIDTLKASGSGNDPVPYSLMHYNQQVHSNVVHNNNGYAVISVSKYMYTGGAHGMFTERFLCFDMLQKKAVRLSDVLVMDSIQLGSLLEKQLREQYNIPASSPLTEILFDNRLALTQNFYFTSGGIGFLYQPYEIAAYAAGPINIWVPYTELKPYLNPGFIQKMGI